jgi:predicted GNAT family N-acyltransferase
MTTESKPQTTIVPVKSEGELLQALAIREVVFIEEQHVPEGIERDDEDSRAYHVLAMQAGHAVGTGRLVLLPKGPDGESGQWAQVGRMAVLQTSRNTGVGKQMLLALEEEAKRRNVSGIILHAQLSAMDFYKRFGYLPHGAVFEEAGMPHLEMKKKL